MAMISKLKVEKFRGINNLKIEYAKTLICQNRLSIAEVSSTVGFADANYFSRFFKLFDSVISLSVYSFTTVRSY